MAYGTAAMWRTTWAAPPAARASATEPGCSSSTTASRPKPAPGSRRWARQATHAQCTNSRLAARSPDASGSQGRSPSAKASTPPSPPATTTQGPGRSSPAYREKAEAEARSSNTWGGRGRRCASLVASRPAPQSGSTPLRDQGQDVVAGDQLARLVGDLDVPGHHALAAALGVDLHAVDLALGGQARLDGVADGHRLDEAQRVQAVVGQHRARGRADEQAGRGRQHEVAVGDALAEGGLLGGQLVKLNFIHQNKK